MSKQSVSLQSRLADPLDGAALTRVWRSVDAESCPRHYNFHLHTTGSDGRLQPEELIAQAVDLGLAAMAITDHHSVSGFRRAWAWLESFAERHPERSLPHLWTGVEVNADLLGAEVHLLCYAFNPDAPEMLPYLRGASVPGTVATDVATAAHAAGGLVVLAHPFRYPRSGTDLIPAAAAAGIDGVETYYAYRNPRPWQPSPKQSQQSRELGDACGLFHTCGTDTHGPSLLCRL